MRKSISFRSVIIVLMLFSTAALAGDQNTNYDIRRLGLLAPKGRAKHAGILTHFQTKVKKKRQKGAL